MNQSAITVRYAKSLYEIAVDDSLLEKVMEDILSLQNIIAESPEFNQMLVSPIIKPSAKIEAVQQIFSGKLSDLSIRFIVLLIENHREEYLPDMCRNFLDLYKVQRGVRAVTITTAKPLQKKHKEEIYKYIAKKFKLDIELEDVVDESIIGGFKLRIDDQQIDAAVSSKLNKIKRELTQ